MQILGIFDARQLVEKGCIACLIEGEQACHVLAEGTVGIDLAEHLLDGVPNLLLVPGQIRHGVEGRAGHLDIDGVAVLDRLGMVERIKLSRAFGRVPASQIIGDDDVLIGDLVDAEKRLIKGDERAVEIGRLGLDHRIGAGLIVRRELKDQHAVFLMLENLDARLRRTLCRILDHRQLAAGDKVEVAFGEFILGIDHAIENRKTIAHGDRVTLANVEIAEDIAIVLHVAEQRRLQEGRQPGIADRRTLAVRIIAEKIDEARHIGRLRRIDGKATSRTRVGDNRACAICVGYGCIVGHLINAIVEKSEWQFPALLTRPALWMVISPGPMARMPVASPMIVPELVMAIGSSKPNAWT